MSSAFLTEHFLSPANVGDIESADGTGRAGSLTCGAALRVSLSVDTSQRILDAKFKAAGCSYLVAACSFLTAAVHGMTTADAAAFYQSPRALIASLPGDWPSDRYHCASLPCEALVLAIRNYSTEMREEWAGDDALICTCFGVSERTIEAAIQNGQLRTIGEVTKVSKAGGGCQSCFPLIEDILDLHARERDAAMLGFAPR